MCCVELSDCLQGGRCENLAFHGVPNVDGCVSTELFHDAITRNWARHHTH
jgi:hypothetical protein